MNFPLRGHQPDQQREQPQSEGQVRCSDLLQSGDSRDRNPQYPKTGDRGVSPNSALGTGLSGEFRAFQTLTDPLIPIIHWGRREDEGGRQPAWA